MEYPPAHLVKAWLNLIDYEMSSSVQSPRETALQQYLGNADTVNKYIEQSEVTPTDKTPD